MTDSHPKEVIVLGAGVVGLTTALKLQQQGKYRVTIVAEILPSDPKSIRYTSHWAGAHHVYNPLNSTRQHVYEEETFKTFWEMSAPGSDAEECFLRVNQTELFYFPEGERGDVEPLEKMPNFRYLTKDEIPSACSYGATFKTVTVDTPVYLNYLLARFLSHGGRILRGSIMHVNQILEGGTGLFPGGYAKDPLPDAVIVCVGIGARVLGGVEDKDVYPIRGQTVLVRAPWVRSGITLYEATAGAFTYIIPRRSSDVIVGGTRVDDDWYPLPREEITEDILTRGLALCPHLAPPEIRTTREPTVDDIRHLVVGEGCGLRPARKGGIRLELEWVDGKQVRRESRVPVIHNYGHGGYGFQASWGCASKVMELLETALGESDPKKYISM